MGGRPFELRVALERADPRGAALRAVEQRHHHVFDVAIAAAPVDFQRQLARLLPFAKKEGPKRAVTRPFGAKRVVIAPFSIACASLKCRRKQVENLACLMVL